MDEPKCDWPVPEPLPPVPGPDACCRNPSQWPSVALRKSLGFRVWRGFLAHLEAMSLCSRTGRFVRVLVVFG